MDKNGNTLNARTQERLDLLGSLTRELDTALLAITRNELTEFEESIARQEHLAWQLDALLCFGGTNSKVEGVVQRPVVDLRVASEIDEAHQLLRRSSQVYEAVLQHASHSGRLMISLFHSRTGNFQEASGARRGQQTWSGQM